MIGQASYYAQSLHRQFRSALLMLLDAMHKVPTKLWKQPMWLVQGRNPVFSQPWYVIYHALFFADLYLESSDIGYTPPAPFNLDELDPAGKPPAKVLNQHELEQFIEHILAKADSILPNLDEVSAQKVAAFSWGFSLPYHELVIDNIRHIQEHAAQINMFIGQGQAITQHWVSGQSDLQE